ncbi:MAG: DUF2867 domain-containing protein [Cyclobacteriaceae bacterium]
MSDTQLSIPPASQLHQSDIRFDYSDAYGQHVHHTTTIEQVALAFLNNTPNWLVKLTVLKDKVVKSYQQKDRGEVEKSDERFKSFILKSGEKAGHFIIKYIDDHEIIFARTDKSIDVQISMMFLDRHDHPQTTKPLVMSTVMQVNNWWGKMSMVPLKPFHQEMAPFALENIVEELQAQQKAALKKREVE